MTEVDKVRRRSFGSFAGRLALGVAIIGVFMLGFRLLASPGQKATTTGTVTAGGFTADGTLETEEVDVASKLPGRLARVLVEEGDSVSAGQVVAVLEAEELDAKYDQGIAGRRAAEAQLEQGHIALELEADKCASQVRQAQAGVDAARATLGMTWAKFAALERGARPQEKAQVQAGVDAARATLGMAQAKLSALKEGVRPQELANAAEAVTAAEATLEMAQAMLSALKEGARPQEIEQAKQGVAAAQAVYDTAKKTYQRVKGLADEGLIAQQKADETEMAYRSATAQLQAAKAKLELAQAGARSQEIDAAVGRVHQAQAGLDAARNTYSMAKEGPRTQELEVAKEQVQQATAALEVAKNTQAMALEGPRREEKDAAREQVHQAQAGVDAAQRALKLAQDGHLQINIRQQDVKAAIQKVAAGAGTVREVQAYQRQTRIASPINGRVTERHCRGGEIIAPGYAILSITRNDGYWVHVYVDESQFAGQHVGEAVRVSLPALDSTVDGHISRVLPAADFATKRANNERGSFDTRALELRITLDHPLHDLASGMTARVYFPARSAQ